MRFSIKPSKQDLQQAQPVIETTIETCKSFLVKEDSLEISLSWHEKFSPEALNSENLILYFNTYRDDWSDNLSNIMAQGYAQAWFLEYKEISFHWENILQLGHSLVFAEHTVGLQPEVDDIEVIEEEWPILRENLDKSIEESTEELNRLGFSVAYYIAKELSKNHELEEFTELTRSTILETGDTIFT